MIVSIVLAMAGWHYWALVWGSVTQTAVVAAGAWLVCRWIPSRPGRASGTGSGLKFAMNVYSHFAFSYLTRNTDNLLVGWRYGARALGFYKKAYDLFVLPETQLLAPMSAVVVSTLAASAGTANNSNATFCGRYRFWRSWAWESERILLLVGKDLIRFLLGPGWERLAESSPYSVRESESCCCITRTGGFIFRSAAPRDGFAGV